MVVLLQTFFPQSLYFILLKIRWLAMLPGSGLYAAIRRDILGFHSEVRSSHCVSDLSCTFTETWGGSRHWMTTPVCLFPTEPVSSFQPRKDKFCWASLRGKPWGVLTLPHSWTKGKNKCPFSLYDLVIMKLLCNPVQQGYNKHEKL